MFNMVSQALLMRFIMCALAFEDFIYVYGEGNKEMTEQGRTQYQVIKERGRLPKYGTCWRAALEHLNEGCKYLSEDTQSDIALHITNCFLEMSGHKTYNCELDKKPNLRGICISSMSDRAFNVYTEFYTHTQNICWFLRGQIWHETIAENTLKVGKQLEVSTQQQEDLLRIQKESIELQERMLQQGMFLEKVMEDVYLSAKTHQELLKVLTQSVSSLEAWIVGEVSWIDSIIFNMFALCLVLVISSSQRTMAARLPLFFLLFLNLIIERLISSFYTKFAEEYNAQNLYSNIYNFVWYSRYAFTFLGVVTVLYCTLTYQDILVQNLGLLNFIKNQNSDILKHVERFELGNKSPTSNIDYISENGVPVRKNNMSYDFDNFKKTFNNNLNSTSYSPTMSRSSSKSDRECLLDTTTTESRSNFTRLKYDLQNRTYNLRNKGMSRQGTPDSGFIH